MATIIGFAAESGSGKDAAADVLVEEFRFVRMKFADALRDECWRSILHKEIPRCVPDDVRDIILKTEDPDMVHIKPTTPEMRRLLQFWGEWRRSENEDYWVERLKARRSDLGNPDIVITDPRHDNEGVGYIQNENKGLVWRIVRPSRQTYGNPVLDNHVTEQWVRTFTGWNATIINDGTLDDLHHKVRDLARCHQEIRAAREQLSSRNLTQTERQLTRVWEMDWMVEEAIIKNEIASHGR